MIYEIKTIDGVKTKVPLTGNGYGLPLGTIIAVYSNTVPDGFLPCNGTTYDTTTYSALYAYLGSNKLPDLRECVLVGAGQSDNEYDANDNPTGIQAHDIYTVGQFKDDQIQNITGKFLGGYFIGSVTGAFTKESSGNTMGGNSSSEAEVTFDASLVARTGTTTHSKQIGVNYCIKATPAYVEPDTVSDMVNTLRTQDSYSTEEVNTGKKWIDGKPIYRKAGNYVNYSGSQTLDSTLTNSYIDSVIACGGSVISPSATFPITGYVNAPTRLILSVTSSGLVFTNNMSDLTTSKGCRWWVEYTKTTD